MADSAVGDLGSPGHEDLELEVTASVVDDLAALVDAEEAPPAPPRARSSGSLEAEHVPEEAIGPVFRAADQPPRASDA